MKRGEVHWADLLPRSLSEQKGRRPVIVVSHDGFNQNSWMEVDHGGPQSPSPHLKASANLLSLS
jgi:hypothetical protein